MLRKWFEEFVTERRYVQNVSCNTLRWYEDAWRAWRKYLPEDLTMLGTGVIIQMREAGLSPVSVNGRLRALNAWLRWLYGRGYIPVLVKLPKLREDQESPRIFTPQQLQVLLKASPKSHREQRIVLLVALLIDTGLRIAEALTLRQQDIDFDNLLLHVRKGKGGKDRLVPISQELLRRMYRGGIVAKTDGFLFASRRGTPLLYRNARRDFALLCKRLGVSGPRISFHPLRHTMATEYLKSGGDVFSLQRILGHSTLSMTQRYVHMNVMDLSVAHQQRSLLRRLGS